jgi:hypothetical protein
VHGLRSFALLVDLLFAKRSELGARMLRAAIRSTAKGHGPRNRK